MTDTAQERQGDSSSKIPGYAATRFREHEADLRQGSDLEPDNQPLYAQQQAVPRLPLPELEETFEMLLQSVRPLASDVEFDAIAQQVADFGRAGGLAPRLQERLQALQRARADSSWLSEMWNDYAYLSYRESVVWNVSYYLQFKDEAEWAMCSPTLRAARFIHHALAYREQLNQGELPADSNRGIPMCMSQHKFLFNTCRIPGKDKDFVRTFAPDLFGHIVVARKNRFYVVQVLDPLTGAALGADAIAASLDCVVAEADRGSADADGIGILTAMDRDSWHAGRQHLLCELETNSCQANCEALELIESSILLVCLDEHSPHSRNDVARSLIHADGHNRFWDKSIQLVLFDNGKAGCICEHSMTDGTTTAGMINYVLERMSRDAPMRAAGQTTVQIEPRPIDFALDKRLQTTVRESSHRFSAQMASKDLDSIVFRDYGKAAIKSLGMSPDAFVQIAIQLAHFRTYGCFRATYESTQTRSFLHGRTEVTRSVSRESIAFCKAMESAAATVEECRQSLRAATEAHSAYIARAARGHGCDRHLLGLKMMMQGNECAELYSDPAYQRAATWHVSTSALAGEFIEGWGFGEVVSEGIGVGYHIAEERASFTVCSGTGGAAEMTSNIQKSLRDMWRIAAVER